MATTKEAYDQKSKAEMFQILRREILAARLKVTLDKKRKRQTSDTVKRLAAMELPPILKEDEASPRESQPNRDADVMAELVLGGLPTTVVVPESEGPKGRRFQTTPSKRRLAFPAAVEAVLVEYNGEPSVQSRVRRP